MKPISSLTPTELQRLVSYSTQAGTTIFYSDITHIGPDSIMYREELLEDLGPQLIATLTEGKCNFEAYKLLMTPKDVSTYLNQEVDKLLTSKD